MLQTCCIAVALSHANHQTIAQCKSGRCAACFAAPVTCQSGSHLGDLEGDAVVLAQLLQLRHDALRDAGDALRIQAVHHALHQVDLRSKVVPSISLRYQSRETVRMGGLQPALHARNAP